MIVLDNNLFRFCEHFISRPWSCFNYRSLLSCLDKNPAHILGCYSDWHGIIVDEFIATNFIRTSRGLLWCFVQYQVHYCYYILWLIFPMCPPMHYLSRFSCKFTVGNLKKYSKISMLGGACWYMTGGSIFAMLPNLEGARAISIEGFGEIVCGWGK